LGGNSYSQLSIHIRNPDMSVPTLANEHVLEVSIWCSP
jgi:hypothetical protein